MAIKNNKKKFISKMVIQFFFFILQLISVVKYKHNFNISKSDSNVHF